MDILNTVNSAFGGGSGQQQGNLMSTVMELINRQGGLQGLISRFNSKGLGDVVGSWVSTGENKPINPDQVQNAIGADTVNDLAAKSQMDPNTLKSKLAEMLPQVVDKLTPNGKVPEGDVVSQGMGMLGGLFGKK